MEFLVEFDVNVPDGPPASEIEARNRAEASAAATLVDDIAFELGLLVSSTHSTPDGYAGDEVLLAPAYTSTDAELDEMVKRFRATIDEVEKAVTAKL